MLVTNDDSLPLIEIDENYPSNFHTEHQWLNKVNIREKITDGVASFRLKQRALLSFV